LLAGLHFDTFVQLQVFRRIAYTKIFCLVHVQVKPQF
jgi:hypothetical protein